MKAIKQISALLACILISTTASLAVQIRREPGSRLPESVLPTDRDNPALWTPASSSRLTRAALPGAYATNDIPRTGTIEYILVLVEFKDLHFTISDTARLRKTYERMYNETGYSDTVTYTYKNTTFKGATGSVSEYFNTQSYGQYTPKFRIIGPIQMSRTYVYYGKNYSPDDDSEGVDLMVKEVCDSLAARHINLSGYARNGSIDQLSIIYAGRGENYPGSDPNTIWPQSSVLYYYKNGVKDIKYACTCELYWDSDTIIDGIGTFCHEFSHTLGLMDYYNTSGSDSQTNASMGYWSIMDYGNYENEGFSPVGYTAFEKYCLGWMDIEEITYQGNYILDDISKKPDPDAGIHCAYRLSAGNDNQFIVLENHTKTGWYKYHAAEGLMVTAISYDYRSWISNTINDNTHKRVRILPADNNWNRITNAGDLDPYKGIDSITTRGRPALCTESSYPLFSVYNISKNDGKVSFRAAYDMTSHVSGTSVQDVSVSVEGNEIVVNAPAGSQLSIHDISGKTVIETVISAPNQRISLPGRGIWIVKCGNLLHIFYF